MNGLLISTLCEGAVNPHPQSHKVDCPPQIWSARQTNGRLLHLYPFLFAPLLTKTGFLPHRCYQSHWYTRWFFFCFLQYIFNFKPSLFSFVQHRQSFSRMLYLDPVFSLYSQWHVYFVHSVHCNSFFFFPCPAGKQVLLYLDVYSLKTLSKYLERHT